MWKPPKRVVFGVGRVAWTVTVIVLRLSDFERAYYENCSSCGTRVRGKTQGLPCAFWCDTRRTIHLREDRRGLDTFRTDFTHELDHAYIDWRGFTYEQ